MQADSGHSARKKMQILIASMSKSSSASRHRYSNMQQVEPATTAQDAGRKEASPSPSNAEANNTLRWYRHGILVPH